MTGVDDTAPCARYEFRPVLASVPDDDLRRFAARLRRALRAAYGLGLRLRLTWGSGPNGGVFLEVPPRLGERWVLFGLTPAYEPGQWRVADRSEPAGVDHVACVFSGRGSSELPFPTVVDEPPWAEPVQRELMGNPPGVQVVWDLVPDPEIPPSPERAGPVQPRSREETRYRSAVERNLTGSIDARRTAFRWRVSGRVLTDGRLGSREAGRRVSRLIEAASHHEGGNGFRTQRFPALFTALRPDPVLTEAELVGLFPSAACVLSSNRVATGGDLPRLWLGRDVTRSAVGLPIESDQGRHLLVLGETGMGKSTLVNRLAWQAVRWGSVTLFDPIGDTARCFVSGLSEASKSRVAWVSPRTAALRLNLLSEFSRASGVDAIPRDRLLADVVAALRHVRAGRYSEATFWGPRIEEMLFQALGAVSQWPGASLAVAERLLAPEGFNGQGVPGSARDVVRDVRRRIERSPADGDGARRVLSEITRSEILREMLDSAAPTWSVGDAVAPGRVTIVSGDAPHVGETAARHLLAIILALLWNALLARDRPFKSFIILDEAQWYAHESVAAMLRLGRRFNLHVWAVSQSMRSLPEEIRDAFMTNSADIVMFRGDPSDARDVSRWMPSIVPDRVMRLARGEAAILLGKGSDLRWIPLAAPRPTVRGSSFTPRARVGLPGQPTRVDAELGRPAEVPARPASTRTGAIERFLRQYTERGGLGTEVLVHLADLRSHSGTEAAESDSAVRAMGRLFSSAGVIVRRGKDDTGSYWVVSRERLKGLLETASASGEEQTVGAASVAPLESGQDAAS